MYVFAAKLLDHLHSPLPFTGPNGDIIAAADRWALYEIIFIYHNFYLEN